MHKMVKTGTPSSSSSPTKGSDMQLDKDNDSPKYKGVRKRKWGKWVSEIRLPNSRDRIWLGSYDAPEKAARAFDAALYCLRGRNATFNFPNDLPTDQQHFVEGQSLSPQEIREVAAKFANEVVKKDDNSEGNDPLSSSAAATDVISMELDAPRHEVDYGSFDNAADWSFMKALDSYEGISEFGLHYGQEHMTNDYNCPSTSTNINDNHHDNHGVEFHVNDDEDEAYNIRITSLWNF